MGWEREREGERERIREKLAQYSTVHGIQTGHEWGFHISKEALQALPIIAGWNGQRGCASIGTYCVVS
jgi:hypothetical protein